MDQIHEFCDSLHKGICDELRNAFAGEVSKEGKEFFFCPCCKNPLRLLDAARGLGVALRSLNKTLGTSVTIEEVVAERTDAQNWRRTRIVRGTDGGWEWEDLTYFVLDKSALGEAIRVLDLLTDEHNTRFRTLLSAEEIERLKQKANKEFKKHNIDITL